jgi:hypothetical protein
MLPGCRQRVTLRPESIALAQTIPLSARYANRRLYCENGCHGRGDSLPARWRCAREPGPGASRLTGVFPALRSGIQTSDSRSTAHTRCILRARRVAIKTVLRSDCAALWQAYCSHKRGMLPDPKQGQAPRHRRCRLCDAASGHCRRLCVRPSAPKGEDKMLSTPPIYGPGSTRHAISPTGWCAKIRN